MKILKIKGYEVILDDDDFGNVSLKKWSVHSKKEELLGRIYFNARNLTINGKQKNILLHRMIAGCITGDGKTVDHKNGNTLDNRKENLRVCTNSENARNQKTPQNNTSGYKGVSITRDGSWQAQIRLNRKIIYLGRYKTKEDAYIAYCDASKKYHGEFSRLS